MEIFFIVISIAFISIIIFKWLEQRDEEKYIHSNSYTTNSDNKPIQPDIEAEKYQNNYLPYAKGHLLTKTEHVFFITLVREALKRRLLVCPKVRLEDIIYVTDKKNRNKYRGYIKSRHVDFVLLDKSCQTAAAIELDDPSHNTAKATKTDQFKNELFSKVGIPLIRICTGTDYIKEINYAFDELKFPKAEIKKTEP